jgi:hypothetical protein
MILWTTVYCLIAVAGTCFGSGGYANGLLSFLCQYQAFCIHVGGFGAVLWTSCIAMNLLLKFSFGKSLEDLRKIEIWYHVFIFMWTWVPATIMLIMTVGGTKPLIFGSATIWCWISAAYADWRLYIYYFPIWACIFFNIGVYTFVYFKIRAMSTEFLNTSTILVKYAKTTSLYVAAAIFCWTFASLNRIVGWTDPTNQYALIFYLQCITVPCQGFLNLVIMLTTSTEVAKLARTTQIGRYLYGNMNSSTKESQVGSQVGSQVASLPK